MPKAAPQDWYRNSEWNDEVAAAFHAKLARARSQKPQYLVIQAGCLARSYPDAALELIEQYFDTADTFHTASARHVQAEAHIALGNPDAAVDALKEALEWEAEHPSFTTNARLDFPRFVAVEGLEAEYDHALSVLDTKIDEHELAMPIMRYIGDGVRAIIADTRGQKKEARALARSALAAAMDRQSPFARHKGVGLVESTDTKFGKRVARIARGSWREQMRALLRQ